MKRRDRQSLRSAEAEARQKARNERTDTEQLTRLEEMGYGNCKEAVRLRESITADANKPAEKKKPKTTGKRARKTKAKQS